jgi:hypothetical protein
MTSRLAAAALVLALTVPLHADFRAVAHALDSQRGVSRVWIPFLSLARAAVWLVRPQGVGDFQLAVFRGADRLDAGELQKLMRAKVGSGYTPLVQAWSKKSREWSFIYAKASPDQKTVELMILAHDDEDTVLVRVNVDPETVAKHIELEPRRVRHMAAR